MKVAIIVNPVSGRNFPLQQTQLIVKRWPFADWEVELIPTSRRGHAGEIARSLCTRPPDLLAVCGGDGTMNEVVSSLPEPPFPVALIPAGTAGVLARELSLPSDLVRAFEIALRRKVRRVDLGCVKSQTPRRFLLMAGVGFDAHIVAATRLHLKQRLGIVAYYLETARSVIAYPFTEFRVALDGAIVTAVSCIAANAKGYGGGLALFPAAEMADGLLDILILQPGSRVALLWFLISARLGNPRPLPFVRRFRTNSLAVEGSPDVLVQVDGESAGTLPAEIGLSHAAFPLVIAD